MEQNKNMNVNNEEGFTIITLVKSSNINEFNNIEDLIEKKMGLIFYRKINDFDSLYWHFNYGNVKLVLHYNNSADIEIYPENCIESSSDENNKAIEFAGLLIANMFQ